MLAPARNHASMRRLGAAAAAACAVALIALVAAGTASAGAKTFSLGFDSVPSSLLGQTKDAGADVVRIDVNWDEISPAPPVNPTDPADPTYNFGPLDDQIQAAAATGGLRIMLTVARAPAWAAGSDRPPDTYAGVWKPNPEALGAFAQALAKRYSGTFTPLGELNPLPQIRVFEAWNEPNLGDWLSPQYEKKKNLSVEQYRRMLNAFYEGVHAVDDGAQVIGGSTGPFGETPTNDTPYAFRTRPLLFARDLLCLDRKLEKTKCKTKAKFDIYAHHPINIYGGPRVKSLNNDDLSAAIEATRLKKVVHAAEKHHTLGTGGSHPLWATEMWWESDPPDTKRGFPLADQARYYEESFYLLSRAGFDTSVVFQFIDSPTGPDDDGHQSGVLFDDHTPKPSYTAVRFPFVTDRLARKKVRVWSVPPLDGTLEIQERHGKSADFKTIERVQSQAGAIVQKNIKMKGRGDLRGVIGGETSLAWFQTTNNEPGLRIDPAAPTPALRGGVPGPLEPYAAAP
jgi:hypothetical protein